MNSMVVLLRLIRYSPRYFIMCVLFAILVHGLVPIPLGLAAGAFFNALSTESAGLNVWSAIALLVATQLAEVAAGPMFGNPWNSLQQKSRLLLERNLLHAIMRGYGQHGLRESIGDSISRFRDDPDSMADGLDALCDLIGRTFFAIVAVVVMWRVNAAMTLVLCVPLLLTAWLVEVLGTRTMAYRAASRAATSGVTGFLGELLGAHLAVTVAGALDKAVTRLNELGEGRRRLAVRDSVFDVLQDSFSINLGHIGAGVVLLLGAQLISDGQFGVGEFALFVVYLDHLVWYPAEIGRLLSDLKRIRVAYGRMLSLVPGAPAATLVERPRPESRILRFAQDDLTLEDGPMRRERERSGSESGIKRLERLDVRGLSYAFPNGGGGIRDVSFTLERGSFTVITGRIGSGKSTLVQVLLGLLPHESGETRWNGRRVEDPATFFVPPRSAYTPQVPRLFSASLRQNILLGRPVSEAALEGAVLAAVLERDVAALELGLDTIVGPRGVKLSGGQIQRAAAARMFVSEAALLVLDDLSSALDAETEAELWSRLFARHGDVTCLVVSHRPAALRRADQILVLEGGRLVSGAAAAGSETFVAAGTS